MNLILHIGLYKTGTTYLQAKLWRNRLALLTKGILFAPELYRFFKNFSIQSPADENLMNAAHLALSNTTRVYNVKSHKINSIIISCETLCFPKEPEIMTEQIDRITHMFDKVHIILSTRRQDSYIESSFVQSVKRARETKPFQERIVDLDRKCFDWNRLANAWSIFSTFKVYPYEIHKEKDLAEVFFSMFTDLVPEAKEEHINPTLSKVGVEKMLELNNRDDLTREQLIEHSKKLMEEYPKPIGEKQEWFTDEQRQELLDYYAESNVELFKNYMPEYRHILRYYHGL